VEPILVLRAFIFLTVAPITFIILPYALYLRLQELYYFGEFR
jgi:hypothetical protein